MPNEPYVEEIMVADGDGDHPSTEEVKYEQTQISDDVIGVKGNDETSYRNGRVNITQDNIVGNNDTANISDSDLIIFKKNSDSKWYRKAFSKIWDYIKGKIGIATSGSTFLRKDGTWVTPTDTKYPKAVKNITRSGTTFTATCYDDTTFTFTQQDNDTKYPKAVKNITRSGLTFTATCYDDTTFTFTQQDNDNAVTQTISSSDNANYRVLLSGTADNTTRTEGARKDADLYYNPSTNTLTATNFNGIATKAKALTNLEFSVRYAKTITSSAAKGAEICACTVGHASGKFLVFFNIQWFSGNVWFHLIDVSTGGGICDCVGGSNASGMAVGWLNINSDRWLRVTCDTNLSNATIAIRISLLRLE